MTYLTLIMRHPCSPVITSCGFLLWLFKRCKSSRLVGNAMNHLERGDGRFL